MSQIPDSPPSDHGILQELPSAADADFERLQMKTFT